jgi:hypothetical protein
MELHLWQVADSSEQHGLFKCELKRAKQFTGAPSSLLSKKSRT